MTDKLLKQLLDKLNQNKTDGLIFIRPLTTLISIAKIWNNQPSITDSITETYEPFTVYLIKNTIGIYVGAVHDAGELELHWYNLPQHRGDGHLTNAMKEVILPYLFQNGRVQQRITIEEAIGQNNFSASENVAKSLGFTLVENKYGKAEYHLKLNLPITPNIESKNSEFTEDEMKTMKKKIQFFYRSLAMIKTELEMKLGEIDLVEEMNETTKEIRDYIYRVEDLYYEANNKVH